MGPGAADIRDRLCERLIAAALVPRTRDGRIDQEAMDRYAGWLGESGVDGVAIWAHTGRGPMLTDNERRRVAVAFRDTAPLRVAGIGVAPYERLPLSEVLDRCAGQAALAAELGIDALMVFPPPVDLHTPDAVLAIHRRVAAASGLPLIGFMLYPEGGGWFYPPDVLLDLTAMNEMVAVKLATLDSPTVFQDTVALLSEHRPETLILTGEDRFLGASLCWGAHGALLGVTAARPDLSVAVVRSWREHDWPAFIEATRQLDHFAQATFRHPLDGYVQRMLWVAEHDGIIPEQAAFDPHGHPLQLDERPRLDIALEAPWS